MQFFPYESYLKPYSRDLRNEPTKGETALWNYLRNRSMMGYRFLRQKPLDKYIVDFYCPALKLVIEVDGEYHNWPAVRLKDEVRQKVLEGMQLNFLRFTEKAVCHDIPNVLRAIEHYIADYEERFPDVIWRNERRKRK